MKIKSCLTVSFLFGFIGANVSHAQTVNYATSFAITPLAFLSDGTVDDQLLTWTLGYFDDGFNPDSSNFALWGDRWNELGFSTYSQKGFGGTWVMSEDVTPPALPPVTSKVMWVFAYNNLADIGTPAGQVLLYTQNQNFASGVGETFDIEDSGASSDSPFTVVWGQVDRDTDAVGGVVGTNGVFSQKKLDNTSALPVFEAQAGSWAAVPEASSALLGVLGYTLLLNRRRRL